jgi:hypothetical protein
MSRLSRPDRSGALCALPLALGLLGAGCGSGSSPSGEVDAPGVGDGGAPAEGGASGGGGGAEAGSGSGTPDAGGNTAADGRAGTGANSDGGASTAPDAGVDSSPQPMPRDASSGDAPSSTDASPTQDSGGLAGAVYAFPGALGFGRSATGGRGGTVVHVTNLNDSGAGSFRDAVSAGNRIVVFDVGGYIAVSSPVSVSSNVTIAGQTAPGDGIGIQGNEVSFSAHTNAIVRYMRFRQGCTTCTSSDPDFKRSGINLAGSGTMIFDHVSIEFAQWNNIDSVGATNVTVQSSISADPVGQQFAAHTEGGPYTWFGNLFANAHNRNPLAKANTQYANNVVYNYQAGYTAGNTAGTFSHDVVGSYFIAGPSTSNPSDAFFQVNNQPIFNSGNLLDGNANGMLDGTSLANPAGAIASTTPWSTATASLPTQAAPLAYAAVVAGAGASLHRDAVDALVVADLTSLGKSGHLWTSPTQTGLANGGFGTLNGGTAPADTDGDGMPDAWERRYGLNPSSAVDASGDFDHTGYTNIEKYINGLADGSYP